MGKIAAEEIVIIALPFLQGVRMDENEQEWILEQKEKVYAKIILEELVGKPNRVLIICNPGASIFTESTNRFLAFAKHSLGERFLKGPARSSITTFFSQVDFSNVKFSPSVKILAYGEHGGYHDCVKGWGRRLKMFLEIKGMCRVFSIHQPTERMIKLGDDDSRSNWLRREKRLLRISRLKRRNQLHKQFRA